MRKRISCLFFLMAGLLVLSPSLEATFKVKKKPEEAKPVFQNAEEERLYRLGKGEILTDGGYLSKRGGVWGKMAGVIQAPPDVVWRLFIHANDWKQYGIPNMLDSRSVTAEIASAAAGSDKVEEFYKVMGGRVIDTLTYQKPGGVWTDYTFQHYDLPWPVANRWMVVKNANDETRRGEGIFRCSWVKVAGNVRTIEGSLILKPFSDDRGRTLMEYNVRSDPGSSVPRFLVKWGVKKSMPAAIRAIRRAAARLTGRPPPLLKTQ